MEPSMKSGTILVISKLRYGLKLPYQRKYLIRWAKPSKGEVVVFYTPAGALAVKRCAAITGNNTFFAEGDNGLASYDSRSYGQVPIDSIIGKVLGY